MVSDPPLSGPGFDSMAAPLSSPAVFRLTIVVWAVAQLAVGEERKTSPPLQLPCLAELVEHARSGEGPLAFEEAFFDGPYHRVKSHAEVPGLIDAGYALLHGFWNAEAERQFREAFQRDPDSVEALIGLALSNVERPRRFATFVAKADAVAKSNRTLDKSTRWWLETLRAREAGTYSDRLERRAATHPGESLPTLWLAREAIFDFHRVPEPEPATRAAWDRLLASVSSPAASTYRRLLWASDPPKAPLPGMEVPASLETADAWRIASEFEKGRGALSASLELLVESVRADLDWLAEARTIRMPDEAQNLGANAAALATLLADLGRFSEAEKLARRFRSLPHHPDAAGTTQPWRRLQDTCREANTRVLAELEQRRLRRETIRTAISDGKLEDAMAMVAKEREQRPHALDAAALELEIAWRSGDRKKALVGFTREFRERFRQAETGWLEAAPFVEMSAAMNLPEVAVPGQASPSLALDSLSWTPPLAPTAELAGAGGVARVIGGKQERATLVIFYLGAGCPRCVEQLTSFLPHVEAFAVKGVDVIGVSTDDAEFLDSAFPIALCSDPTAEFFRACGVYDEFADRPLHGTLVIDANGRVTWRAMGNTAFLHPGLLLNELDQVPGAGIAAEKH